MHNALCNTDKKEVSWQISTFGAYEAPCGVDVVLRAVFLGAGVGGVFGADDLGGIENLRAGRHTLLT